MKLTLLQYVQSILSALDSDEVNSISDNTESMQVAEIVRTTYFNIIARTNLPEHKQLIQLEPSLNPVQPVLMVIPDGIGKIEWLYYYNSDTIGTGTGSGNTFSHELNTDIATTASSALAVPPGYLEVTLVPVREFVEITTAFNPSNSDVASFSFTDSINNYPGSFTFYYKNSRQPTYATVISDNYILFDSFDSTVDSTLQTSKVMAYGEIIPTWKMVDTFIPNLDELQVPLLLNEAKSLAFFELKQSMHSKAEQEAKRQWSAVQKDKSKVDRPSYFNQLANFGRNSRPSYSGFSYFKMRGWDRP